MTETSFWGDSPARLRRLTRLTTKPHNKIKLKRSPRQPQFECDRMAISTPHGSSVLFKGKVFSFYYLHEYEAVSFIQWLNWIWKKCWSQFDPTASYCSMKIVLKSLILSQVRQQRKHNRNKLLTHGYRSLDFSLYGWNLDKCATKYDKRLQQQLVDLLVTFSPRFMTPISTKLPINKCINIEIPQSKPH